MSPPTLAERPPRFRSGSESAHRLTQRNERDVPVRTCIFNVPIMLMTVHETVGPAGVCPAMNII